MMWSLIALSAALSGTPAPSAQPAAYRPTSAVTDRARVSVTILHAAQFGRSIDHGQEGAQRKSARLADAAGQLQPAQLLEFE